MNRKNLFLIIALVFIVGSIFYLQSQKAGIISSDSVVRKEIFPDAGIGEPEGPEVDDFPSSLDAQAPNSNSSKNDTTIKKQKMAMYHRAVELADIKGFINADEFNLASLVGKKVILIDFWTYSCINCIRTFPYLNSWYEKYKDQGFVIVGVHSPEFEFEKKYENVRDAVKRFGIQYPVVLDSNHGTWNAYGNLYWPAGYLIDIDGFVIHRTIGEGRYDEIEREIQKALLERMNVLGEKGSVTKDISKPKDVALVGSGLGSPEVYFGAARNKLLGNGVRGTMGEQTLSSPTDIKPNTLYLSGAWNFESQFAENKTVGAKIIFRYKAKNVYIVGSAEKPVTLTILRDGKPLDAEAGEDARSGKAIVQEDRLYKLIDDPTGYGEHTLEITIENPGFRAFTFTFG